MKRRPSFRIFEVSTYDPYIKFHIEGDGREIMAMNDDKRGALTDRSAGLEGLAAAATAQRGAKSGLPPVKLWNPPFCGDIDMRIARDGTWFYNGSPIGRPAMVRLFSTILRRDPDRYVLVTPVERVGIIVEDAPFLGVELTREHTQDGQILRLRDNVGDWLEIGPDNPLRFEPGESDGLKPYALVRDDLWALVKRALFYDLAAWGENRMVDGENMFGVISKGAFFPMARAADVESWS